MAGNNKRIQQCAVVLVASFTVSLLNNCAPISNQEANEVQLSNAVSDEAKFYALSSLSARDAQTWPFSWDSPWNHPMGSGAQFSDVQGLSHLAISINYGDAWTVSVASAKATDREVNLLVNGNWPNTNFSLLSSGLKNCGNTSSNESYVRSLAKQYSAGELPYLGNPWSTISTPDDSKWLLPSNYHKANADYRNRVRFPTGVCPSPDTDGLMSVIQPDGWVLETYASIVLSNGDIVSGDTASFYNIKSDGTGWNNGRRASMLPALGGLIRKGEIASGVIPHALIATLPPSLLTEQAVWPAYAFDRNSNYSGTVPMGALLAIPGSVNIDSLGLSETGKIFARAAQNYGIYIADRGGGGMSLQAELGNPEIRWSSADRDLSIIKSHLKRVTNNGPSNRGGGGTPRAAFAPPFIDEIPASTPTPAPAPVATPAPTPSATPVPAPGPAPVPAQTEVRAANLSQASLTPGQSLTVTYNWNATPMSKSLRVFVHFLNSSGSIAFSDDHAPPTATSSWSGLVQYQRTVVVPSGAALGTYKVVVGLFDTTTWERTELVAGAGVTGDSERRYHVANVQLSQPDLSVISLPATLQAESYLRAYDTTAGNSGGAFRTGDVDIQASSLGGYNVGWIATGEYLEFDVAATQARSYSVTALTAAPATGGRFHIRVNGTNVTGSISVPATGNYQKYVSTAAKQITLPAGKSVLRIVFETPGFNVESITLK